MQTYPLVNWWRGNLRQHESYLSLVVRFAHLNGIKVGEACTYLDGLVGNHTNPDEVDITRMANALGEEVTTLQTVIREPIKLTPCPGTALPTEESDGSVRYCEQCAAAGYHSYLHERRWLANCPLHSTPLRVLKPSTHAGSTFVRIGNALAQMMATACLEWPAPRAKFRPEEFPGVAWLSQWTANAALKARQLTDHSVWISQSNLFRDTAGYGKAIGHLYALVPAPLAMMPMFSAFEHDWVVEPYHLSRAAYDAIAKMDLPDISILLRAYRCLTAYSDSGYRVGVVLDACRAALKARHPECRCRWGRESLAYTGSWVPAHPEEWPMCTLTCPNTVARAELELAVGRRFEALSNRAQFEEHRALDVDAQSLAARGLVEVVHDGDKVDNAKEADEHGWPTFRWIGSPGLNEILDAIACAEVKVAYETLSCWLDSIDDGRHPALYTAPRRGPLLCRSSEALELIIWTRRGPIEAGGHP